MFADGVEAMVEAPNLVSIQARIGAIVVFVLSSLLGCFISIVDLWIETLHLWCLTIYGPILWSTLFLVTIEALVRNSFPLAPRDHPILSIDFILVMFLSFGSGIFSYGLYCVLSTIVGMHLSAIIPAF